MAFVVEDPVRAQQAGLISWPPLKVGQSLANISVAFELFGQHPGATLMPIGAYSYSHSHFAVARIGRFCSIADGVRSMGDSHPHHWASTSPRFYKVRSRQRCNIPEPHHPLTFVSAPRKVVIEHDVWIGQDVLLRDGIHIGTGAVIAAGAVVARDVEPYTIVGGNPARLIKLRFEKALADRLLASEWWTYDVASIMELPVDDPERFVTECEKSAARWHKHPFAYKTLKNHMKNPCLASALKSSL